ncbi:transcriptional regulator [Streptomyces sp. Ru73]|uniref:DUF5937 family protein n=1 Tax=Streptomyces sp. Ru73 TaxID=2080748 RepID=UPI000CDD2FAB|nr:DUF5937 family protein [Streptomyces sp. Ru73]POX41457.1 transcriptional regulator [Streptomyces sp. Ru73]
MSVTIDITGLTADQVLFAPSPLSELAEMLHVMAEPGHHPGLASWATATASGLPPGLADRLADAEFLWRTTRADVLLPARPGATLEEELDALDRMDTEVFVAAALEISCMAHYDRGVPQPLISAEDRTRAMERAEARGPRQAAFAERLLTDPEGVRAWLRRVLEDCAEAFFTDAWQDVQARLYADARHKTELLKRKGLAEALTAVSPALDVDLERSRVVVDKLHDSAGSVAGRGLTCIPSAFGWPHLIVMVTPGFRPVLQYPVAAPDLPAPMAVELIQRRLEALAHPVRMRMLRALARGPHTTGELAGAYQLTAPEASRHIARLKKAGLLTTQRRGRYVVHQLDLTAVARLGSHILESVLR